MDFCSGDCGAGGSDRPRVGSFYDTLENDKRRAIEMIVEQRCEEPSPEDGEKNGRDRKDECL